MRTEDAAAAVAALTHGPADCAITLAAWSAESNPLVTALGPDRWLAVKVMLVAGFAVSYAVGREHHAARYVAGLLALLGLLVVGSNLAYLGVVR